MQHESENRDREVKLIAHRYGADHLDLVLATGDVSGLLGSVRVVRYMAQHHADIHAQFQKIVEVRNAD